MRARQLGQAARDLVGHAGVVGPVRRSARACRRSRMRAADRAASPRPARLRRRGVKRWSIRDNFAFGLRRSASGARGQLTYCSSSSDARVHANDPRPSQPRRRVDRQPRHQRPDRCARQDRLVLHAALRRRSDLPRPAGQRRRPAAMARSSASSSRACARSSRPTSPARRSCARACSTMPARASRSSTSRRASSITTGLFRPAQLVRRVRPLIGHPRACASSSRPRGEWGRGAGDHARQQPPALRACRGHACGSTPTRR